MRYAVKLPRDDVMQMFMRAATHDISQSEHARHAITTSPHDDDKMMGRFSIPMLRAFMPL